MQQEAAGTRRRQARTIGLRAQRRQSKVRDTKLARVVKKKILRLEVAAPIPLRNHSPLAQLHASACVRPVFPSARRPLVCGRAPVGDAFVMTPRQAIT